MNDMVRLIYTILGCLAAYAIGGISPALIIGRRVGGCDIRSAGSGNAGSTNVLRVVGVRAGVLTALLDGCKGILPALLGGLLLGREAACAIGCAAVLGHVFPAGLGFRGGKGVATSFGVLLALSPWLALGALAVALGIMFATRYVSLGSITGAALLALYALIDPALDWPLRITALFLAALVIIMHRANIGRLLNGTENRIDPSQLSR